MVAAMFDRIITELFASGRILEFILAGMAIEAAGLVWWHRRTGTGLAPAAVLPYLLSGMAMLLAWRLSIGGAWWGWISACLLTGGLLHLLDLRRRLNS